MVLKKNEVYKCNVCSSEVTVISGGNNIAPLTCCGMEMILIKASQ